MRDVSEGHDSSDIDANERMDEEMTIHPDNERLMIVKVILENFKSYGGVKTIGPFHTKFSSIVGPNGSGKSNVIDAMLFVFGKRAAQIRLKRVSELIHKSAHYPNLDYARVSVHFQMIRDSKNKGKNAVDVEIVPDSQFVISRDARLDNTSKYAINGRTAQQKEILTLLKAKGVDLEHNRFLILQGEVEQIAQMKPKALTAGDVGLLEYLEDMIGSNKYVEPIEAKDEEVERQNEEVSEKRNRMGAVRKEVEALSGPRLEAERYCKNERRLINLKAQLEQILKRDSDREQERLQTEFDTNKAAWDKWREARALDLQQQDVVETKLKEERQKKRKLENSLAKLTKEFEALESKDHERRLKEEHCHNRIRDLKNQVKKLQKDSEKAMKESEQSALRVEILTELIPKVEDKEAKLSDKWEQLEKSLEGELDKLTQEKDKAEQLLEPIKQKLDDAKQHVHMTQAQIELLEEKRKKALELVQRTTEQRDGHKAKYEAQTKALVEAEKNVKNQQKMQKKLYAEVEAAGIEATKMRSSLREMKAKVEEKEATFKEAKMEASLVSSILSARDDGELPGVVDTLWNLGVIEPKFELALDAAASSDYIVCEDTSDAERVVDFVRRRRLGRVTCIVLSRVRKELTKAMQETLNQPIPEGASLLLNLIQDCSAEHKVAFFFVLRDTLVANDMTVARKIAFSGSRRWRVATLDGGIVDKSGTMTGGGQKGGTTVRRGHRAAKSKRSGQPVTAKEIEDLRVQLSVLQASSEKVNEKKTRLEDNRANVDEELATNLRTIPLLKAEINSLVQLISQCEGHLQNAEVPKLTDEEIAQLEGLRAQLNGYKKAESGCRINYEEAVKRVEKIEKAISGVGGEKRKVMKTELDQAKKEITALKKEKDDKAVKIKYAAEKSETLLAKIPATEKEIQDEEHMQEKLQQEKNTIEDEAMAVMERREEEERLVKEQAEEEKKVEQERDRILDNLKTAGLKEVEFQNTHGDLEAELAKVSQLLRKSQRQLESFATEWEGLPVLLPDEDILPDESTSKICADEVEDDPMEGPTKDEPSDIYRQGREDGFMDTSDRLLLDLPTDVLDALNRNAIECRHKKLASGQEADKPDFASIEKYRQLVTKFRGREKEFVEARQQRDATRKEADTLRQKREHEFLEGFQTIAEKLREMYQMITTGGDAELELGDASSPFTEGILFSVRPPRKSWKQIQNLSGGEKTLSSLALVFALHHYKPTPVYFMDEIDAALDHRNVAIIARYLEERMNAQFIIISLRHQMFERADRLVGIYKTYDITKSVALDPGKFVADPSDENSPEVNEKLGNL